MLFLAILFFFVSPFIFAQTNKIQGKVIDASTKTPIEGVTVSLKNSNKGISTNSNGEFSLNVPENSKLTVTFVGYEAKEITASQNITIELAPSAEQLINVVVTALGVRKDVKRLGYSIQEVKGSDLTKARESNPIDGLTGKVAGLNVGINQEILASPTVLLRGSPLNFYVVDGIPINSDTWNISPDDIETLYSS